MYNLEEMIWGRKICFIAPANSIHTKNGVSGLAREVTKYTLYH